MNIVEYALEQVKDGVLPVSRPINCHELTVIHEIAKEAAKNMPGGIEENIVYDAIGAAYNYGFWQGWKHCEAERPDLDEISFDEDPADREADISKEEVTV